jgi:membrane protease YdiL (CAAX protease family)
MAGRGPPRSSQPALCDIRTRTLRDLRGRALRDHAPELHGVRCDNGQVPLALLALFLVVAVLLVVRAANRDRRDYREFKILTSTRERQLVFAKWLRESFLLNGGIAAAVLLASWNFIGPASRSALSWPPMHWLNTQLSAGFGIGVAVGAALAAVVVLVLPVFLLRRQASRDQFAEIPAIGDVAALLPRTRGELKYGAALSINAGIVEELLFRLGMPALLFGITGNGALSFLVAAVLFGLLHIYQKALGVIGATVLGIIFSLIYLLTGSIWVVIIVHALVDLRSLVLLPVVLHGVWRKTGAEAAVEPPPESRD